MVGSWSHMRCQTVKLSNGAGLVRPFGFAEVRLVEEFGTPPPTGSRNRGSSYAKGEGQARLPRSLTWPYSFSSSVCAVHKQLLRVRNKAVPPPFSFSLIRFGLPSRGAPRKCHRLVWARLFYSWWVHRRHFTNPMPKCTTIIYPFFSQLKSSTASRKWHHRTADS